MHEVGIMQNAILMAEQQARESGAGRVHTLRLRVGAMSGVVPDALEFAFETVAKGTLVEGAELVIEHVAPACWCATCRDEFECADLNYDCPPCGTFSTELRRGMEMQLSSIEVS
jgi:hydrogenase nickel incorporation protein HypA/HybF